ncbi:MAG: glucosamine-6-phosphate isomerase [Angelakisella sp.]|nr:glucosamine-6-phosphate isomerase [Angelakisella sp.]
MGTYENVSKQELLAKAKIPVEVVETEDDIYYHMALDMLEHIEENNARGKNTVFIVPVGPIGQYRRLAYYCNKKKVSLKNVYFFNMDEYLNDDLSPIALDSPLSFAGFMDKNFYDLLDEEIVMPKENRIIPAPGMEDTIWKMITQLGGVDVAYGGIGINGHIAFNEPPEPDAPVSNQEFKQLPTRILKLSRETRTINSVTAANGYIDYIPKYCITIGMKEILSARKIRFYMNRTWQKGIVRKLLLGEVTPAVPSSFFQEHPDAKMIITSYVAEPPVGALH